MGERFPGSVHKTSKRASPLLPYSIRLRRVLPASSQSVLLAPSEVGTINSYFSVEEWPGATQIYFETNMHSPLHTHVRMLAHILMPQDFENPTCHIAQGHIVT